MSDDAPSKPAKRARSGTNDDAAPAISTKRRKLSSSTTYKRTSLHDTNGNRPSKTAEADIYDVPDSDGEVPPPPARTRLPSGPHRSAKRTSLPRKDPYEVSESDKGEQSPDEDENNEDAVPPTPTRPRTTPGKTPRSNGTARNGSVSAKTSAGKPRALKEVSATIEKPVEATPGTGEKIEETIHVRSSGRRRIPTAKVQDNTASARKLAGAAAASRSRSNSVLNTTPSAQRHHEPLRRDAAVPLKGILTPSKRAGDTGKRRKSVAFGAAQSQKGEPVFFEDLPNKSSEKRPRGRPPKYPKATPKPVKSTPRQAEPVLESEEEVEDEVQDEPEEKKEEPVAEVAEEEEEEEKEQEDTACSICDKRNSRPPNEIIFCDGCDKAVHQKCYDVHDIPEGDWFCKECVDKKQAKAAAGAQLPNYEHHLRSLQRVLLDRCTGRRRIKLINQDEAYTKVHQLVEQTVSAGEGNSMLVIGARGCGKTTLVENIIAELSFSHKSEFHVIRLNGFIHTDDKLALKEIWRQLGKEMEVDDDINAKSNYADTMASLLALLSHPSEISQTEEGVTSKAVIFIIDEFDMFASHARQTLLYNLFDIAQARKAPIAVLGCTTRMDVVEMLEKRVKSRFSHRHVYLSLPANPTSYWQVCRQGLTVDDEDMKAEGIDEGVQGHVEFYRNWNNMIKDLHEEKTFKALLQYHYYTTKSAAAFLTECILPLSSLSVDEMALEIPSASATMVRLAAPNSKLHLLSALSDLDLGLLIAAARLDIVAHTDTVNFAMAYDEYGSLMGRHRVQSAGAGMMALGGGVRVWGRGVAGVSWERLVSLGLLLPASLGGGKASGGGTHGGLEGRMWKVDVALEEIPGGVKLSQMLAGWCKAI
ncbi:Origin recognition complex subunit 4 like protein [Verticillium longisporum]|uniref:Origin recognition complex subunit 4 n=1 Tax=Verticillium longisporum TaxID=100787 RepID=A0A8I2ZHL9_VERLO|nr:Origin recognition complex subunit 4 like protein [Verticillium longisporum]RBQ70639.1 hypothetical protein VDGD_00686 [Verticillium dahliae]